METGVFISPSVTRVKAFLEQCHFVRTWLDLSVMGSWGWRKKSGQGPQRLQVVDEELVGLENGIRSSGWSWILSSAKSEEGERMRSQDEHQKRRSWKRHNKGAEKLWLIRRGEWMTCPSEPGDNLAPGERFQLSSKARWEEDSIVQFHYYEILELVRIRPRPDDHHHHDKLATNAKDKWHTVP